MSFLLSHRVLLLLPGRWKPLHYAVKRMYAQLAVQVVQDGSTTQVFVVNDHKHAVPTTIAVQLLSLADSSSSCNGTKASNGVRSPAPVAALSVMIPALYAARVWSVNTTSLLGNRPGCSRTTCFVRATATAAVDGGRNAAPADVVTNSADLWFAPFSTVTLRKPQIQFVHFQQLDDSAVKFTVRTDIPAVYLSLHTGKLLGHFSDGAVTVHPCQPATLVYRSHEGAVTAAQLQSSLTAETLYDHQQFRSASNLPPKAAGAAAVGAAGGTAQAATASVAADSPGSNAESYIVGGLRGGGGRVGG